MSQNGNDGNEMTEDAVVTMAATLFCDELRTLKAYKAVLNEALAAGRLSRALFDEFAIAMHKLCAQYYAIAMDTMARHRANYTAH